MWFNHVRVNKDFSRKESLADKCWTVVAARCRDVTRREIDKNYDLNPLYSQACDVDG